MGRDGHRARAYSHGIRSSPPIGMWHQNPVDTPNTGYSKKFRENRPKGCTLPATERRRNCCNVKGGGMTPARGDRFQLAPGGNAAAANPGSASCAQAARKRMPTRVTPQHCLVYAADHAAESAGVEDAAASSSSGGRQSDTKGGARLDAMPLASAGSRISHGGGRWDEDGWQRTWKQRQLQRQEVGWSIRLARQGGSGAQRRRQEGALPAAGLGRTTHIASAQRCAVCCNVQQKQCGRILLPRWESRVARIPRGADNACS